jgi:hypothetical protein
MRQREFVYPGTDLDRGRNLLALLGSFWLSSYAGKDQINSYVTATAELVKQTLKNLYEVVAATSRKDVPVFHEETIVPVTLRRSDLNGPRTRPLRFDTENLVFDGTEVFDQPQAAQFYVFPLPPQLVDIGYLFNKITFPTAALVKNTDFLIDRENNALIFAANPFENDGFLREKIVGTDDVEITLWGFSGKFDYDYVFEQFAYAIGLRLRSSDGYKELMNAVITGLIDGGVTAKVLDTAISAICGIPLALDTETVEVVRLDRTGLFIATDKNVYRFSDTAEPVVVPGQALRPGDYLIRGFEISEFFVGNTYLSPEIDEQVVCQVLPETILATNAFEVLTTETDEELALVFQREVCSRVRKDLSAIALDAGFLSACFWGDLVFEDKNVPLEIDTAHPSGYTYIKFGLGGFPADVEHFFDEVHRRGIERLTAPPAECPPRPVRGTLAHVLDRRKNINSEPTAATLPKTINPLRFLIENILRNNVFVVRIIVSALGQNTLGLYNIRHLRALIPPQTAMIVVFELATDVDKIYPDNIVENVTRFKGATPISDTVPESLIRDVGATARIVSGTCQ